MTKMGTLIAAATTLTFGLLQSTSLAIAHGHGRGGHGGVGHLGGSSHLVDGGGHHHDSGGGHNTTNDNNEATTGAAHYHYDHDDFWDGAAVGAVVGYGIANRKNTDPCAELTYRREHPDQCSN